MTKENFIKFLDDDAKSSGFVAHFVRVYSNSDDYWNWYMPGIDCLEDDINLSIEGKVIFTYNKSLYDNESAKSKEFTYEEFLEKFYKIKA